MRFISSNWRRILSAKFKYIPRWIYKPETLYAGIVDPSYRLNATTGGFTSSRANIKHVNGINSVLLPAIMHDKTSTGAAVIFPPLLHGPVIPTKSRL
jgi:hypothetical protein